MGVTSFRSETGSTFGAWTVGAYLGHQRYQCACVCGESRHVSVRNLRSGISTNCGCLARKQAVDRLSLDLVGQRFGRLVVQARAGEDRHGKYLWRCICDCGGESTPSTINLRRGISKSCGCGRRADGAYNRLDVTGQRFGRLVAVSRDVGATKSLWLCACDCGKTAQAMLSNLRSGNTTSCGCVKAALQVTRELRVRMARRVIAQRYRAKKAGAEGDFTVQDVIELLAEQDDCCAGCSARLGFDGLEIDHKIALARGGRNDRPNLQMLCRGCNAKKWALLPS